MPIYVDDRTGSKELAPLIRGVGLDCEITRLEYGDACVGGIGPQGDILIGVERKTLADMLACIEDARYSAHQLPGMKSLYTISYLIIEGLWCAGDGNGYSGLLMQGYRRGQSWGPLRTRGNRTVLYSKLFRYLLSVQLAGVIVIPSIDIIQTAWNICELAHYFSKEWHQHTALRETQKLAIPILSGRPPLVRRWAQEIDDVGVVFGEEAAKYFRTPIRLANSDEQDWLRLTGHGNKSLGVATAQKIVRGIRDWKL